MLKQFAHAVRSPSSPKGTRPDGFTPETVSHTGHEDLPPSPPWVPALMFSLLGLGIAVILLNYVGSIWDTNNGILLLGLGMDNRCAGDDITKLNDAVNSAEIGRKRQHVSGFILLSIKMSFVFHLK